MSSHKPMSFVVLSSALFAASCVTVVASPGRAAGPGSSGMGPMNMEMAQATDGTASAPAQEASAPVAEGAAAPEGEEVHREHAGHSCPPGGGCEKCKGMMGHGAGGGMGMMPPGHGDPEKMGPTDHQRVVGRWGIEARSLGTLQSSSVNPDPRCGAGNLNCRDVRLTSIGIRRWHTERYAYSAGLSFGAGGGSTSGLGSWDTYIGVGPNFGAYFLLSQWKHLAVSASPQLGFLYFAPSGSGNKTVSANVAGKVEAELQLGFLGLPGLSVGTDVGLGLNYTHIGNDSAGMGGFSYWNLGTTGPSSLWGMATNGFVRFYL
jgi:hypothetical protein